LKKSPLDTTRAALQSFSLQPRTISTLLAMVKQVTLPANEVLVEVGHSVEVSALVLSGVLREVYVDVSGTERTRSFSVALDWAGSYADVLQRRPSRTRVEVLDDASLLLFPMRPVLALAETHDDLSRLLRSVAESLYLKKSEREFELLTMDAARRYARFQETYPLLEARIQQRHIASYLKISPVHLSRLRRRMVMLST
jgi:CRP-like cAMP-binding protein